MSEFQLDEDIALSLRGLPEGFQRFGRIYQTDIRPTLQAREGERENAVKTARNGYIGGGLVALIGGGAGLAIFQMMPIVIAAIIGGIAIAAVASSPMRKLSGEAKDILVEPIARSFDLDYVSKPAAVASIGEHRSIGLVPSYDRSRFEDLLTGAHNGVPFEFFEANLKQRRTTTSNGKTRTKYVTVFDGQCIKFAFDKRFFGRTLVTRDAGIFNRFSGKSGMDRARLEDPDFEKAFEVYTTDQVEARFLLTPDMMQSLVDLEETFRSQSLRCAFSDQFMYIAVEGGDLFEPGSLFKPLDNPERVRELLLDFSAVFNLIDKAAQRRAVEERERGADLD